MTERPFIVAIDGPAGAGKSTVSRVLARRLGFTLVDTGAIYRSAALVAQSEGVGFEDESRLTELLDRMRLSFRMTGDDNRVLLGGRDVSAEIRTPEISMAASQISAKPLVRTALLPLQRRLALEAKHGAVLEGRDIGTVVFPDAEAKFFLQASPEIRARRRYEELFQKGVERSMGDVLADQARRDRDDSLRQIAPLRPAEDAIVLDSSLLPVSEVVQTMERIVRERMSAAKPGPG
ncbi:MAG TPA: (d)CMP kinase [Myxococcaceae bacterium]|nr:(d)CMP kinase [Myxococcaceae bacterium]